MPQIIVTADRGAAFREGAVTFRERVNVADFESEHFMTQLVERLGWAVEDADEVERVPSAVGEAKHVAAAAESGEEVEPVREERVTAPSPA
jgi:hypothetical protein